MFISAIEMPNKLFTGFAALFCFCFFLLGSIIQRSTFFVLDVGDEATVQAAERELTERKWDLQDGTTGVVARRALLDRLMLEEELPEDDEEDKGKAVRTAPLLID